jgi:hypothetical protein
MADRFPLTPEETRQTIFLAIILHIEKLPQLKGKGTPLGRREDGIKRFADAVHAQLKGSGIELTRGPPLDGHSTWSGPSK